MTRRTRSRGRVLVLGALVAVVVAAAVLSASTLGAVPSARAALGLDRAADRQVETVPTANSGPGPAPSLAVEEPMNILILGVDRRPNGDIEAPGTRSDTIMLAHVEPATGEVQIVSVPRDLYVEIAPGRMDKINAAYSYYGIEGTVSALGSYGDVPIDHYAVVDFHAFRTVVNQMGGLEVDVQGEFAAETGMETGLQTLDGNRALMYARFRGTEGGDLDRIRRQQQVVAALRGKAMRWESLSRLPDFARIVGEKVETDLGVEEGIWLGEAMLQNGDGAAMTATQLVGTPDTLEDGTQILVPDDEENQRILAPFQY